METQAVRDVLVRAMVNEQDGYEFYVAAVARIADAKGKAVFRSLANDETEHLRILQNEYERISQGQSFADLDTARKTLPAQPALKLFPEKSQLDAMLAKVKADIDVLKVALDFERKGYDMYSAAAKNAADHNVKAVFTYLANVENGHYELIDKTLSYLTNKGMWLFDEIERPFFEG
jgi:rubrerythrin